MKKTVEKDGIRITLEVNDDNTVDLNRLMHIKYANDAGEVTEFEAYPDVDSRPTRKNKPLTRARNYGTIEAQFEYVKAALKFDDVYNLRLLQGIKQFLDNRPQLSKSALSVEAGFSPRYLPFILGGDKRLTKNVIEKLMPVLRKYGYEQ